MSPIDPGGLQRITIVIPAWLTSHRPHLEEVIEGRATLLADDEVTTVRGLTGPTVVVTGMSTERLRELLEAPGLRWVHSTSSGVEHIPLAALASRGVLLTNSAGAHAPAMAEHALGMMIALAHGLPAWAEGQRARRWLHSSATPVSLLHGKRLGIIGYGAVGRQLATAARALGMSTWAARRTPVFPAGEPLDRMLSPDALPELLAECDFIVLCASLNTSSRHVLGAAELALMRPGAFLVNVARGDLVEEVALASALVEARLGGAAVDATSIEPLPETSPLWDAPHLLLTPHVSGSSPESWQAVLDFLDQNLRVYLAGVPERLGNLVRYDSVL